MNLNRLAGAHVPERLFLVVGQNVDLMERHGNHYRHAWPDEVPDLNRPLVNQSINRCWDPGVAEIKPSLFELGAILLHLGDELLGQRRCPLMLMLMLYQLYHHNNSIRK